MAVVGAVVVDVADCVEKRAFDAGDRTLCADAGKILCGGVVLGTEWGGVRVKRAVVDGGVWKTLGGRAPL